MKNLKEDFEKITTTATSNFAHNKGKEMLTEIEYFYKENGSIRLHSVKIKNFKTLIYFQKEERKQYNPNPTQKTYRDDSSDLFQYYRGKGYGENEQTFIFRRSFNKLNVFHCNSIHDVYHHGGVRFSFEINPIE